VLPDDVLLDIFDFCLDQLPEESVLDRTTTWQTLVHVCPRWRDIVFQSPRRLDLQILCTFGTHVGEMLDIWPALPLIMWVRSRSWEWGLQNIFAALEHRDRISSISVDLTSNSALEALLPGPFPALTSLHLVSSDWRTPAVTASFLRGPTPHLRHLCLAAIPFPTLPTLLLSSTNLVTLTLRNVPYSGYISPEAMATCLFALIKLERLELRFQSPTTPPDPEILHPHTQTHAVLPALTWFDFKGPSQYLEDLVVRIDVAPVLECLQITFFNQPIFRTQNLSQFISGVPKFQALNEPRVVIFGTDIFVAVPSPTRTLGHRVLTMGIPRRDCQPPSLAHLFISSLSLFYAVEDLYMTFPVVHWRDIENHEWLELLYPFTFVKNLYLSKNFALRIASALQELVEPQEWGEEVLPVLQNIFLEEFPPSGPAQQAIDQLVNARQLSGPPLVVSQWVIEENMLW
jgi:hypothetical protein